jgi:hypothetical protein
MMSGGSSPEGGGTLSSSSTTTTTSSTSLLSSTSLDSTTDSSQLKKGDDLRPGEAQRAVTFTVSLSNASEIPISVAYQTVDGTAKGEFDYTPVSGVLTFAEDETVKTITVMVAPDALHEMNEAFSLKFSNPIALIMPKDFDSVPGQIEDDDAAPTVDVTDVSVIEGNDGVAKAVFTVTLASVSGKQEVVKFSTADGTAVAGVDYEATGGYLVFEPGIDTLTVSVAVMGDKVPEKPEDFFLHLAAASDAVITKDVGVATIVDDDMTGWTTTTSADFRSGTLGTGTYVSETQDGELTLAPALGDEFSGTALSTAWTVAGLGAGGVSVGGGKVTLDQRQISQGAGLYAVGRTLEYVATFTGDDTQYVGLNLALFSTDNVGNLYAQTSAPKSAAVKTLIPGTWMGAPHQFRITWNATNVVYAIDGVVVATHNATWPNTTRMFPVARDMFAGTAPLVVDWLRLSGYAASGTYTSKVFNAGSPVLSFTPNWAADLPAGTTVAIEVRSGATPVPDATWTAFAPIPLSGTALNAAGQYVQFRAVLKTTNASVTPALKQVDVSY